MKEEALAFIRGNDRYILTAHETPDADAIGSECATYHALRQLGKTVRILNADPTPQIFSFIDTAKVVEVMDASLDTADLHDYGLLILDSNDVNNIGSVKAKIIQRVRECFIIDHHEEDGSLAKTNYIEGSASSTCELLYGVFLALDITITYEIAIALYSGIVYDTGCFAYPKTSALTFLIAQRLVESGVDPNYVYTKMYESNTVSSLLLRSMVLSSLKLYYDKRVAVQKMAKETLEASGAPYEEGQTLINIPLKSESIRVSVFLKQNKEGIMRCSLRSKGDIDVAAIATAYGGGGHKNAAGFKTPLSLDEIEKKVLEDFKHYFV